MKMTNLTLVVASLLLAQGAFASGDEVAQLSTMSSFLTNDLLVANQWSQPTDAGAYVRQSGTFLKSKRGFNTKLHVQNTELGYVYNLAQFDTTLGAEVDFDYGRLHLPTEINAIRPKVKNQSMRVFANKHFGNDAWIQASLGAKRFKKEAMGLTFKNTAILGHIASGHKFMVGADMFVEPSVKLAYARLASKTYLDAMNTKAVHSLVGTVAVKAAKTFAQGNVWAQASLGREFLGRVEASEVGRDNSFKIKNHQCLYGFTVGGSWSAMKNLSLDAKVGIEGGNYLKVSPSFSLGARYNF